MKKLICIMVITVGLSGCTFGPDFIRPFTKITPTTQYLNAPQSINDNNSMSKWWEQINDPVLNGYINKLLTDNLSLKQAEERYLQSRENLSISSGSYSPTVGVEASNGRSFANSALTNNRAYATSYAANLTTSWQIDLFGKISKSVESANALSDASSYDVEALKHALISQLINQYVAVSVDNKLLVLAKKNVKNRKKLYNLVKNRYDLGTSKTTISDVYLAKEQSDSAKANVNKYERSLSKNTYSLDVVLGQLPGTNKINNAGFLLNLPIKTANICPPAYLLDRRPDLKSSKLRAKSANANIGVAIADVYPSLSLGGVIGFNANNDGNLFTADQLAGSILGQITSKIFQGGKLRANIRLQESKARELALSYSEDVLNAIREVETALSADIQLQKEIKHKKSSLRSLKKSTRFAKTRYEDGIGNITNYLDIQQRQYNEEQAFIALQQTAWNTRVSLYLSLGGDWFDEDTKNTSCKNRKKS